MYIHNNDQFGRHWDADEAKLGVQANMAYAAFACAGVKMGNSKHHAEGLYPA